MQPGTSPEVYAQIPTEPTLKRRDLLRLTGMGAFVCVLGACTANSESATPSLSDELQTEATEPVTTPTRANPTTTTTTEKPAETPPTTTEKTTTTTSTTAQETLPAAEREVVRPIRPFAHEELVQASLTFRISSTDETINLPLHAFTDPGDSLNDGEILGSGGIVVTGDVNPDGSVSGFPYNVLGIHEPHVDENGNMRPMVVGYHRTTYPAALINVTKIRVNDGSKGEADILEYEYGSPDGKQKLRFKAVKMHIVQDGDGATLSRILKPTPKQRVFIFACTEFNASSQAAVEAANNGTNDVEDSYPTDPDKNPNARILVEYELVEDTPLTLKPL
jgi:hypothetical protein